MIDTPSTHVQPTDSQSMDSQPAAQRTPRLARLRPWLAIAVSAALFALVPLGVAPLIFVVPAIGLLLALGAPADHLPDARAIAAGPRNAALGGALVTSLAVVIGQPLLMRPMFTTFGPDLSSQLGALLAVLALALPLAMTEDRRISDLAPQRAVLTRRSLILSLTIAVSVAVWYVGPGLSFLPIAVVVLLLPVVVGTTRLVARRQGRLEYGLLHSPAQRRLRWQRLQLANVAVLAVLLALTQRTGAYDATALGLSASALRAFQIAFLLALAALVLLTLVTLRRIRWAPNLLALAASVFVAVQLVGVYRPAVEPVAIASPLADEWYVGQGGHAELVNYHHVSTTQRDALDIMQVVDGRTHRPGATELSDYYIFDSEILAPADGVVTYVLDGRPDLPIGQADHRYHTGNHVVIDIGGGRFVLMGHMREGSIGVQVGDRVRTGQPIARVGNSGNTSEPHIHLQVQSVPYGLGDVETIDVDTVVNGLHTYPVVFTDATLTRDGVESESDAADPRRGDLVRPIS